MEIDLHHHGKRPAQHPWPENFYLQGGEHGVVLGGKDGGYETAFVEVSTPSNVPGFMRGEGSTIAEAEDAVWAKYQRLTGCPGHEWEPRSYRNGSGFCKHCGIWASKVIDVRTIGADCAACGSVEQWNDFTRPDTGERVETCKAHTPHDPDAVWDNIKGHDGQPLKRECSCGPCHDREMARIRNLPPITDADIAAVIEGMARSAAERLKEEPDGSL